MVKHDNQEGGRSDTHGETWNGVELMSGVRGRRTATRGGAKARDHKRALQ